MTDHRYQVRRGKGDISDVDFGELNPRIKARPAFPSIIESSATDHQYIGPLHQVGDGVGVFDPARPINDGIIGHQNDQISPVVIAALSLGRSWRFSRRRYFDN